MKVFIFGAGASKGSQEQVAANARYARASPLVNELFLQQYSTYNRTNPSDPQSHRFLSQDEWAQCAYVAQELSLEQWLSQKWAEIESKKQPQSKFSERVFFARVAFYLRSVCQAISTTYTERNGYTSLLRKLNQNDEPFGLISFNYDTLLDQAIQDVFGYEMSKAKHYEAINYFKPHGSVNWFFPKRIQEAILESEGVFDSGARLDTAIANMYNLEPFEFYNARFYNPRHDDLNHFDQLLRAFSNEYFYPMLFMPLTTKLYPTVNGFSKYMTEKTRDLLHVAKEIYLVGYRAQDDIIKDMFGGIAIPSAIRPRTKLHVVGIAGSEHIMQDSLNLAGDKLERGNIYGAGFWSFAESYRGS